MLQFNPTKRPSASEILRHPYLEKFHKTSEELDCYKIIYPPVSDNKKLNLKQYRNLIYDRIKQFYKNSEEEEKIVCPVRIPSSSLNSSNGPRHQSNDPTRNRPS